jgi:hypothetical protein
VLEISPLPHCSAQPEDSTGKKGGRPSTKAMELTSTPNFKELQEKLKEKSKKRPKGKCCKRLMENGKKRKLEGIELQALKKNSLDVTVNDYVVFSYEEELFPGQILRMPAKPDGFITIKAFQKAGRYWKWPKIHDIMDYPQEDIQYKIQPPSELKRGMFRVPELEELWN